MIENGYVCGNKVPVKGFFVHTNYRCGDYVESQYYNPVKTGARGGIITSSDVCAILYPNQDIISQYEINNKQDVG